MRRHSPLRLGMLYLLAVFGIDFVPRSMRTMVLAP